MTNRERTGFRDRAYSAWHRTLSDDLGFIDLDWIEWCSAPGCFRLLAVCELAVDDGRQDDKKCWITRKIANAAGTKGFLVLYTKDREGPTGFRVRQIAPNEQTGFTAYTPDEWADRIHALRWCHPVSRRAPAAIPASLPRTDHVHGWARKDGVWTCIADHFGKGPGCGITDVAA